MSARFVTFYSYKGGVGRTMTLANVAAWLATEAHKRVFLLDFDLEAPGLSYYASQTPLGAGPPGPGLVEYFTEYRTTARLPDLRKYVIEEPEDRLGGGRLMMIGAGKHGTALYAEGLAALDWKALYESGFGFELVEHLRAAIVEQFQPDIVLVDSRTGLHGIGSIATQQLADLVVIMFGLNYQNIEGARGIVANIEENPYRPETGRDIETILVASPVYDEGSDSARSALRRAEKLLGRRIDVRIPFSAAAVYEERLWPLDPEDAPRALLQVYSELGARLLRPSAPEAGAGAQTFESLIAQLFAIEGYSVSRSEAPEYDLLAERDAFPSRERMAVQIVAAGPSALAERRMRALIHALDRSPGLGKAVLCTQVTPAEELKREAERDRRVAVVSLGELMQRLIPFQRYLESLVSSFERDDLSLRYEPREVVPLDQPEQKTGADAYIGRWLGDAASPHLALLGDAGAGKTSFCRRLAAKLARERLAEGEWTGRVPVLVGLRNYAKALNVESLVGDFLSDRERFSSGSFAAFDLLNREGKLLILLDGFDEMTSRADEGGALESFRALGRLVTPRSKVLLTCRTANFQRLVDEAWSEPGFRTIELAPLGPEQIRSILQKRTGDPEKALELIRKTSELERLGQRPVLLDIISTNIPEPAKAEGRPLEAPAPTPLVSTLRESLTSAEAQVLVTRAFGGDRESSKRLMMELIPAIHVAVTRIAERYNMRSRLEVDDLVQDVAVALFSDNGRSLRAWDPTRRPSFYQYVQLLTRYKVLDRLRRRRSIEDGPGKRESFDVDEMTSESEVDSEEQVLSAEYRATVLDKVQERLSERGLQVFRLLFTEGRSVEEVSRLMGMTPNAIYVWRSRLANMVRAMAQELAHEQR